MALALRLVLVTVLGDMPFVVMPLWMPGAAAEDDTDVDGVCRLLDGLLKVPDDTSVGRMMGEGRVFGAFFEAPFRVDGRVDCPLVNVRGDATVDRICCGCGCDWLPSPWTCA